MTDQSRPEHADVPAPHDGDERPPLGRILVDTGLVESSDLESVLEQQKQTNEPLGRLLVEGGYVAGHSIALALAKQHGGPLKTEYGFASPAVSETSQSPAAPPVDPPRSPEPEPPAPLRLAPLPAQEAVDEAAERYEALRRELEEREAAAQAQLAELQQRLEALSREHQLALESAQAQRERADELQRRVDDDALRLETASAAIEGLEAELLAERERAAAAEQATAAERERAAAAEQAAAAERERAAAAEEEAAAVLDAAAPEPSGQRVYTDDGHLLFLATDDGYRLLERAGAPPAAGELLEFPDTAGYRVVRHGVSPLPADRRRCAYLELRFDA